MLVIRTLYAVPDDVLINSIHYSPIRMCASIGGGQPRPYYTLRLGGVAQCLRFLRVGDSPCLLAGGSAGELWLVSIATKRALWNQTVHAGKAILQVEAVDGATAITYGKDQLLCVWNISEERAEPIASIKQEQYTFCNFSTLPLTEGTCMLCMPTAEYSSVRVLKLEAQYRQTGESKLLKADGKAKECTALKILDRNRESHSCSDIIVVAAYLEDAILVWSLDTQTVLFCVNSLLGDQICVMEFDETRMMGILGGMEGTLAVFRIKRRDGEDILLHDSIDVKLDNSVSFVRLRGDRRLLACGTTSGCVHAISWKSLKPLVELKFHEDTLYQGDYGTDAGENILAVCSRDKRISLWKLY